LAFVKLVSVRNGHKETDGQECHNDESNNHNYVKYVSHARIFPLNEILVLLKVVTVSINEVESRRCALFEVPELRPVPSLLLNVIILFHLSEILWICLLISDLFDQILILDLILLLDLINFPHQWMPFLLAEEKVFNDWRNFIFAII
jgi:hypothetical protein